MHNDVCKIIRDARIKKKMSYNQLAYIMHDNVETMQNIEIDSSCLTMDVIKKLSVVLDINSQELMSALIFEVLFKYHDLILNDDIIEKIKNDTLKLIK